MTWSKSTLSQHINEDRERLCMSVHQITEQGIHSISSISTAGKLKKSFNQKKTVIMCLNATELKG